MKNLILLLSFISLNIFAGETVISFECDSTEVTWIGQFSMKGEIVVPEDPREFPEQTSLDFPSLNVRVRPAGIDSLSKTISLADIEADLYYFVDPDWVKDPFIYINVKPINRATNNINRIKINLGYPGKLTSWIRLKNGEYFRSTCSINS